MGVVKPNLLQASHEIHRIQRREGQSDSSADSSESSIRPESVRNQRRFIFLDLEVHPANENRGSHKAKTQKDDTACLLDATSICADSTDSFVSEVSTMSQGIPTHARK